MKKAKKLLAVLLVLVLALGMVPFAAAERPVGGFTDKAIIDDDEAVEVLTAINVLRGRPDGSFDPRAGVTRAEAVVIVARLLLGAAVADGLPSNRTGFPDVDGVSGVGFASGAIAWAVSQGVVVGRPNGNFEPNAPVKASEFAIMILRAVGYGRNGEYTGTHWETNGILDGMTLGILTVEGINFQDNANREHIARYAFNALNHEREEHLLRYVDWSADISNYVVNRMDFGTIWWRVHANAVVPLTFLEDAIRDDLGRPSIEWFIGDETIGVYARKAALVYTADINTTDMTRNLRGYTTGSPSSVFINGTNNASHTSIATLPQNAQSGFEATIAGLTENGYRVEIYTRPYTRIITDVIVVRTFLGEVVNINPATRQFTFENISSTSSLSTDDTFGSIVRIQVNDIDQEDLYAAITALDLSVRDRVVVTAAYNTDGTIKVVDVLVPNEVTGQITAVNAAETGPARRAITVGGTQYRLSMARHHEVWTLGQAGTTVTAGEATLLLDAYGFVIYVRDRTIVDPKAILVTDIYSQVDLTTGRSVNMITGVLPNGEVVDVRTRNPVNDQGFYPVVSVTGGVFTLGARNLPASGTSFPLNSAAATRERSDLIGLDPVATISSATMSLTGGPGGMVTAAPALADRVGTFFATDVKFIYFNEATGGEVTYTIREGIHATPETNVKAAYAVIEMRNNQRVVTAVYLEALGEDASGLVFVHRQNRIERQPNDDIWTYFDVYRDGVLEVIPFFSDPLPATGQFHNIVQLTAGYYASSTRFGVASPAGGNPDGRNSYTPLGAQPRLFVGTISSLTGLLAPAGAGGSVDLNIVHIPSIHGNAPVPPDLLLVNFTNARVIDLRPAEARQPIIGYPITETGRGVVRAMEENYELTLGIVFAQNTRNVSHIYITNAVNLSP